MLPFTSEDLDVVTISSLEHTAGVTAHLAKELSQTSWIVSKLSVTGPWECHIEVAIDADLALALTQHMWDQESVEHVEVLDAVGEIANVIAGGVKGMTPVAGCGLTLPETKQGVPSELSSTHQVRRIYHVMSKVVCVTASE